MKSIASVSNIGVQSGATQSSNNFYKKIILSHLKKISYGAIELTDHGQRHLFGHSSSSELSVKINIVDPRTYKLVLTGGTIGAGEAYMLGYWQVDDLVKLIRVMLKNRSSMNNMESKFSWIKKGWLSFLDKSRLNSLGGSKKNIVAHYDLSNEFFSTFLDSEMMYSSAIYDQKSYDLEQASINKLQHICERLSLSENDHVIEIGSGWGGMAIYAAQHYGCRVTTTTISDEQYSYAKERVERLGLTDKVTLLKKDYRLLEGKYDKLVSIEMIEAVGHEYYDKFFKQCSRLLKSNGLALIQAITTTDHRYESQKNRSDFIKRYIFPGGCLPSNQVISNMLARYTDMQCVGLEDITYHYAQTLKDWRKRFLDAVPDVRELGFDDIFIRMWDFYLAYCEGGFKEREINTSQFLFAKPNAECLPAIK